MPGQDPQSVSMEIRNLGAGMTAERVTEVFLRRASKAMVSDAQLNFSLSSDPDGVAWKPLRRAHLRGGSKPLLDTDRFRAGITSKVAANSAEVGTTHPGATLQQMGGTVVPKTAKALAIPMTRQSYGKRPRDFPRPLFLLWKPGAPSGVLAEIDKSKQKTSAKEKRASKSIRSFTPHQRAILKDIKALTKKAKKTKSATQKIKLKARIELKYVALRKLQSTTGQQVRDRQAMREKRRTSGVKVQYALVKSVTVPARPFLGFGKRLTDTLDSLLTQVVQGSFRGGKAGGSQP